MMSPYTICWVKTTRRGTGTMAQALCKSDSQKVLITFIMNDRIYDTLAEVISYTHWHRLIIQE